MSIIHQWVAINRKSVRSNNQRHLWTFTYRELKCKTGYLQKIEFSGEAKIFGELTHFSKNSKGKETKRLLKNREILLAVIPQTKVIRKSAKILQFSTQIGLYWARRYSKIQRFCRGNRKFCGTALITVKGRSWIFYILSSVPTIVTR